MDLDLRRCWQIMDAPSEAEIRAWTAHWDDLVEFEIIPVRDSAETAAAMASQL